LGAFVSSYKSAQIDEESGQIVPPSRTVSFDPKIRHDDGLLVGQIAESEHIPRSEVKKRIENEREGILYRLDKGEEVILGSLGILSVNEDQEMSFKLSDKNNLSFDAFGLEPTSLTGEPESIPEGPVADIHSSEPEKPGTGTGSEQQESKAEPQGEESVPEYITSLNEPEILPARRRRGWLWFLLIPVVIIMAGVSILLKNQKKPPASMDIAVEAPEQEVTEALPALVPEDTVKADSAAIPVTDPSFEVAEPLADTTDNIEIDTTKFYLIGGSFTEEENAEKYLQKMKTEGFNPFRLGKKGSFYLVGIEIFDNETEAYGAQYNFLDKYPGSGVWIYIPE
jgi:cell division septation protein DedD